MPLILLIGQAFCYGAALFTGYTASSALFLVDYSAQAIPYVNILTGIVMLGISFGLDFLQKRLPLAKTMLIIVGALSGVYFATWLGYTLQWGRWLSFGGMCLFQVLLLLGGFVLSAQAGQLFNVREIKRLFPFVLAAQSLASPLGGLLMPLAMPALGRIENIILVTGVALLSFLLLLWITSRRFAAVLWQSQRTAARKSALSLVWMLRKPYFALVFCYVTLSIIGLQLVRFVQIHQASIHFTTPATLATFFGTFYGITVFTGFLFSLFVVGRLLTRFGLRMGLLFHPSLLSIILLLGVGTGMLWGPSSTPFLWLAVSAFFVSLVAINLTGVATKTSYQALPAAERVAMQATVEGLGTPVGLGLSGLLLLLFGALPGVTDLQIMLLLLLIVAAWTAIGLWSYRYYAATLVQTLSRRALGEVTLTLADEASLAVVERFLHSQDLRAVRMALNLLEENEQPMLAAHLAQLVTHAQPAVQIEALQRIARRRETSALPPSLRRWR
ncbi:MAG: hypothetical protein HC802_18530 [Caldilineaceae bacterium]|nr:hypothetical protein [Caldilineaceae bacterium]